MAEELQAKLVAIGLEPKLAQTTVTNKKISGVIAAVLAEANAPPCTPTVGKLLYNVACKFPVTALVHRPLLIKYIVDGRFKSDPMVIGAMGYLGEVGAGAVDVAAMELAGGIGQEVSAEQIKAEAAAVIDKNRERLLAERYRVNVGMMLKDINVKYPFGDMKLAKDELEAAQLALLGPKTEADLAPIKKTKAPKAPKEPKAAAAAAVEVEAPAADPFKIFPRPQDNTKVHTEIHLSDGRVLRPANTPEQLATHLKATGGQVWTRFPPEPNGYLHIGHAKAMHVDFGFAKEYGGVCYLRYDDTNPEAEKQEYIDHIQEIVSWMGWQPWKITYSSDYFQELYELAVELIRRGKAYVCHQTGEQIRAGRETQSPSPFRERPVEDNLRVFEEMRRGMWKEGTATLRMKMDHQNENFVMHDLIAYRIKFATHPKAGDKWCIYPSYDYTHCLVDAIENITHSLCTLEFEVRRASYYWLLDALDSYLPHVWEYARLNITNTVLSKRKLNKLVTDLHVQGWDDPRLLTLSGLRRRGAPAAAINRFCHNVGITRNENVIPMHQLEHFIRDELNRTVDRTMIVLHPLKVTIVNAEGCEPIESAPPIGAPYSATFGTTVYIEQSDFREVDSKDYFGLAVGKKVMLRWAFPVTCVEAVKGKSGEVVELKCEYSRDKTNRPKGVIHWVGEPSPGVSPVRAEVRLYDKLFHADDPNSVDDWLGDVNPESLTVVKGAMVTQQMVVAPVFSVFQAERLGYFCKDADSTASLPVLNRTVSLKEDLKVQAVKGK